MEPLWSHRAPPPTASDAIESDSTLSEMPLTTPMETVLRRSAMHLRVTYGATAAICVCIGLVQSVILPRSWDVRFIFGAMWICFALLVIYMSSLATREIRNDLQVGTYCLATGPLRVVCERQAGIESISHAYYLQLDTRQLRISRRIFMLLDRVPAGSIAYSTFSELIFEVRNAAGHVIYRDPVYRPGS